MNSTVAKTYRMSAGVHALIVTEAERLRSSEADVVRMAIRQFFDHRQKLDHMESVERRITERIDAQSQRLTILVERILSLAQPQ